MEHASIVPVGWLAPLAMALVFAFSNGTRDCTTIVATVVSSGALSTTAAFALCALFEFIGALFIGHAVTATMAGVVVAPSAVLSPVTLSHLLTCALLATIVWGTTSWWRNWPTSSSQALVGGIIGADWGLRVAAAPLIYPARAAVFVVLVSSPILGFLISVLMTAALRWVGEWMTTRARKPANALHVLSFLAVSTAHGANYGQIVSALAALALYGAAGVGPDGAVFGPIRLAVAATLAAGMLFGGRVVKKLKMNFYQIHDPQGLGAQSSAAATILACGLAGFPASTTQVVSGSIVGAGVAKNLTSVRWLVVREIVMSWIIALPATALISAAMARLLRSAGTL